ncbi:hypothetical protein FVEN_g4690 [Fusarium venenatum]|nr:hypothetical protein FVEN_g4690 [Fusarium venenatum]KAH6978153.1 hypothetical protein EDB82DRAFT_526251 [Fusarium venenatum]
MDRWLIRKEDVVEEIEAKDGLPSADRNDEDTLLLAGPSQAKFGAVNYVKTQDTIPIRESFTPKGVKWDTTYMNWPEIHHQCIEFIRWLNSTSKIIFLVREENVRQWRDYVNLDETVEAIKIELDLGIKVFGESRLFRRDSQADITHHIL